MFSRKGKANYVYDLSECTILKKEEQEALYRQYKNGDKDALEKLFKSQLRLAYKIVDNVATDNNREELRSEAHYAILCAINNWDVGRGRLSTITTIMVKQKLSKYLQDNQYIIRVPIATQKVLKQWERGEIFLTGIRKERLVNLNRVISLKYLNKVSEAHLPTYEQEFDTYEREHKKEEQLNDLLYKLSLLPDEEKSLVCNYFGLFGKRHKLVELAVENNISITGLQLRLKRILKKLAEMGVCKYCGKKFMPDKQLMLFCSWRCNIRDDVYRRVHFKKCETCGNCFIADRRFVMYCSERCFPVFAVSH